MDLITNNSKAISALCSKHFVQELHVFGSVLTDRFAPTSDVDFVVAFGDVPLADYANNYFDLKEGLEKLLGRQVDLLEAQAIKNPVLKSVIDSSQKLLYAA